MIQVLNDEVQDKNVLRALNANLSIRKGKFGPYIYYKAPQSTKPQFFNIKKYKGSYLEDEIETVLEWIKDVYEVE